MSWIQVFGFHIPVTETVLRGTVVYLVLFALLRMLPKREAGAAGITDFLVVVLIADAAQNAMAGSYYSVSDGILLVVTIAFWAWALNALGYAFPVLRGLIEPQALLLIKDGQLLRHNMRKEFVTREELMSQLRLQGLTDISSVREARMEPDGRISVVKVGKAQHPAEKRRTA